MPINYQKQVQDAAVIGTIAAVLLGLGNGFLLSLSQNRVGVSTDIIGVFNAIMSGNIGAALSLILGIIILGFFVMLIPQIKGRLGMWCVVAGFKVGQGFTAFVAVFVFPFRAVVRSVACCGGVM